MTPKVYFTDFATRNYESLPKKLARLILTAGMDQIDFQDKFVAIKIHFGEPGNLSFIRPNFAKTVADEIKKLAALRDQGILTDEEFTEQKRRLLGF